MDRQTMLSAIDSEIDRLQKARSILLNEHRGTNRAKRHMSEEARARIAAAQKKRWAKFHGAQKKAH